MSGHARRGATVFLTGLSGAGKSTIAQSLVDQVQARFDRPVTLLDGDIVREMLSSGLSFSRADRELNIRRIGFVAGEVTRHGGLCVCAAIAPYQNARDEVRRRIQAWGRFYEVHVAAPLAVCEARDPKGLYRRARRGEIKGFTGIDDPFEIPAQPELRLDTSVLSAEASVAQIIARLQNDQQI